MLFRCKDVVSDTVNEFCSFSSYKTTMMKIQRRKIFNDAFWNSTGGRWTNVQDVRPTDRQYSALCSFVCGCAI